MLYWTTLLLFVIVLNSGHDDSVSQHLNQVPLPLSLLVTSFL